MAIVRGGNLWAMMAAAAMMEDEAVVDPALDDRSVPNFDLRTLAERRKQIAASRVQTCNVDPADAAPQKPESRQVRRARLRREAKGQK